MATIPKIQTVIPSARALIKALRDLGYDLQTSIAEIIDNSIEAGATKVYIDFKYAGKNTFLRIADNGRGMTDGELQEAMRFGAHGGVDNHNQDLGKFGLGLKTASLSHCRTLVVASRTEQTRDQINVWSWDLDHIETTDKWEIVNLSLNDIKEELGDWLNNNFGTVIIWKRLERIVELNNPDSSIGRKRTATMCAEIGDHLAMVFNRFLGGLVHSRNLEVWINNVKVEPWDPFCSNEPYTTRMPASKIPFFYGDTDGVVQITPHILPSKKNFSSPDAFDKAGGIEQWNKQQGFYIYRSDRMIQSGGWSRLRALDEHTKFARIGVFFNKSLDDAFKINISKMQVQIPPGLRKQFEEIVKTTTEAANKAYREGSRNPEVEPVPATTPTPAPTNYGSVQTPKTVNIIPSLDYRYTLEEFAALLDLAAVGQEEKTLALKLMGRIRRFAEKLGTE